MEAKEICYIISSHRPAPLSERTDPQITIMLNPDQVPSQVASVRSFQSSSVYCSEFDAPQAVRLTSDDNPSLSQEILDIPVAEIESVIEPDSVENYIWRESVSLVGIHPPIVPIQ